jgi:hypothetical protein
MSHDDQWRTVCVHYYDTAATDDLILDGVRPLFAELFPAGVQAAHFLRHWRRGPHLRLNFRTTEERMDGAVLPAVNRVIGGFLRARPSRVPLDVAALLPAHRRLAHREQERGELAPPRADNTISVERYDSRAHALGGIRAAELLADFHTATTPAAFAALRAVRAQNQRLWPAFDLMVATAQAFCPDGIQLGYLSFRAHAEAFLLERADQQRMRAEWDRTYQRIRPVLAARLAHAVAPADGTDARRAWLDAVTAMRDRCFALLGSGELRMENHGFGRQPPAGAIPFVRELMTNRHFYDHVLPSAPFRHYRLLLNLLYLHLAKLGVRPAERSLLGHLIANTVEDVHGVDAATQLRARTAATASQRQPPAAAPQGAGAVTG